MYSIIFFPGQFGIKLNTNKISVMYSYNIHVVDFKVEFDLFILSIKYIHY